jgi:hypothetical protein
VLPRVASRQADHVRNFSAVFLDVIEIEIGIEIGIGLRHFDFDPDPDFDFGNS